jgi:hypothetical protein
MEERGKTFDWIALAALAAIWAQTLIALPGLPAIVPSSFGDNGTPQAYSSKYLLLLMPVVASGVYLLLRFLSRLKNIPLNVPFTIPDDRLPLIQPLSRLFIRILGAQLMLSFAILQGIIVESTRASHFVVADSVFGVFMALVVGVPLAIVSWFLYRTWRIARG